MSPTGERPVLSAAEAARAAGVSAKTIGRALKAGRIEGAERLPGGGWAVPVEGLVAAGYNLHRTEPEVADVARAVKAALGDVEHLNAQAEGLAEDVRRLEGVLAEVRRERDVAVARAALLEQSADDLRLALRALTAGPAAGGDTVPDTSARAPEGRVGGPVTRWWRRGR